MDSQQKDIKQSNVDLEEKFTAENIFKAARFLFSYYQNHKSFYMALTEASDIKIFYDIEKFIKKFIIGIYKIFQCQINFSKQYYEQLKKGLEETYWGSFIDDIEIYNSNFFYFNKMIFEKYLIEKNFAENFSSEIQDIKQEIPQFESNKKSFDILNISEIEKNHDFTIENEIINNTNCLDITNENIKINMEFSNVKIIENLNQKIFDFFKSFFSFLNNNKILKEKIFPIKNKLNIIYSLISAFKNIKKTLTLSWTENNKIECLKILQDLNIKFVDDFLILFDFNIDKSKFDYNLMFNFINDFINNNKSPEKIYELLNILITKNDFIKTNFLSNLNINQYLLNLQKNKSNFPLMKKAIKLFPEWGRYVTELYLTENENKLATEIYKECKFDSDPKNLDLKNQIIFISKLKFMIYLLYSYKKKEINFINVLEHFINDIEVIKSLFKKLIDENLFLEAYFVLKYFNYGNEGIFSKILISDFYKLGSNLINLNNSYYKKIERKISNETKEHSVNFLTKTELKELEETYNKNIKSEIKKGFSNKIDNELIFKNEKKIAKANIEYDNEISENLKEEDFNIEIIDDEIKNDISIEIEKTENFINAKNNMTQISCVDIPYEDFKNNLINYEKNIDSAKNFDDKNNYGKSIFNFNSSFFNPLNIHEKTIYNHISTFKYFISNLENIEYNHKAQDLILHNNSELNKSDKNEYTFKNAFLISPNSESNFTLDSEYTTISNQKENYSDENRELIENQKNKKIFTSEALRKFLFFFSTNPELNLINFTDQFAPSDKNCFFLPIPEKNVFLIENLFDFKKLKSLIKDSTYIGIDMEWKSKVSQLEPDLPSPSIIQVSDGKYCFILDYPKLKMFENFYDFFNDTFTGKIFISFSFHNDIKMIDDPKIKSFFNLRSKKENIDLEQEYKKILNRNRLSLSELTMEVYKIKLCKFEQISNWNIRPLRKSQMHYAALDSYILVLLHQKMQEYLLNMHIE